MRNKKQLTGRYIFAFLVLIAGVLLEYFNIGMKFLGFSSVGTWLIYVGFIMFAIITLQAISNKKRVVDERMMWVAFKASRITFILIIFGAFAVMIIDGIKSIEIPYHLFMGYLMAYMMLVYFISYKILLRYN